MVYLATLDPGGHAAHPIAPGRHAWLQVSRGTVPLGESSLAAADAAALSDEPGLTIPASADAEVMLFDLA